MNEGRICVSLCAAAADEVISKLTSAAEAADLVELRFDCLAPDQIDKVRDSLGGLDLSGALIATYRPESQGGREGLDLDSRLNFWNAPARPFGALDLEEDIISAVRRGEELVIASFHDFTAIPSDINEVYDRLAAAGCDVIKIAVTTDDAVDSIPVWKLIERARLDGKGIVPIGMGEAGKWTRILGLAHGAFLTYASLDTGDETAPGQVAVRQMTDTYRVKDLGLDTKVFGIIGDPVSQSVSTFMHNPAFVSEGFNAVFIPFLVKDIDPFMHRMVRPDSREVDLNFGGFSVTMPHKQSIMRHLDEIHPSAYRIGAVNTVKFADGKLIGYNTDSHGFITPLKAHYGDVKDARAAVFGAGGAARACVYALQAEGASVELFVRDVQKASEFAADFGLSVSPMEEFSVDDRSFDIIVDATPLGMSGPLADKSLFSADQLKGVRFVYDLVTKPYDTPIISEAKKSGIPAIGGLEMLIAQGAKQFEIWTDRPAPVDLMRSAVLARFAELNR